MALLYRAPEHAQNTVSVSRHSAEPEVRRLECRDCISPGLVPVGLGALGRLRESRVGFISMVRRGRETEMREPETRERRAARFDDIL